jgi:hypothetical protein
MSKRAPLSFTIEKVTPTPSTTTRKTSLPANTQASLQENSTENKPTNEQTTKPANTKTKKGRAGRQFLAAHVLPEAAKQFKLLAVQRDKTTQEMLIEAINDLFAKHGLSRIAD